MPLTRLAVLIIVIAAVFARADTPGAQANRKPSLLVVLVVDQMRHDYIERLSSRWTRGLKRMVIEGAVFDRNAYPYLQTVTCAGHATIGTGSFPSTHGIILNAWWRGTRNASCTDDPTVLPVGYADGAEKLGHSAVQLAAPTLADRLRERSPGSRVVTLSVKPRSAVMLAGHGGIATWRDDNNVWASSTAFAAPDPDVRAFFESEPVEKERTLVWERLQDASAYSGADDAPGEAPPAGWTAAFPHPLSGAAGTPERRFDTLWETSPFSDAYLGRLAAQLVRSKKLGQGEAVDLLGVSFAALDYVGHAFGPESHEAQDVLLRLDQTIGDLFDVLDATVGRERYVVGFSADHGVAPIPEARALAGKDGGRVVLSELVKTADAALVPTLGPGPHVVRAEYTQIYLSEATRTRVAGQPALLEPAIKALRGLPGVLRVMPSEGLERQRRSGDPVVRAAALSYFPGRSGQIVVVPRRYFLMSSATARGTTHGTLQDYDQRVPLIFLGPSIKRGRYGTRSSPADLAPTLAATINLPMPDTDGRARQEALRR
jgi:predicted AlkP superfamily pyrophosphatase or phosphodiesterase